MSGLITPNEIHFRAWLVQTLKMNCQCMGLQEASGQVTNWWLIVANALPLCLLFLSLPNTMCIIFIYLLIYLCMSEDNPLLTGSSIWEHTQTCDDTSKQPAHCHAQWWWRVGWSDNIEVLELALYFTVWPDVQASWTNRISDYWNLSLAPMYMWLLIYISQFVHISSFVLVLVLGLPIGYALQLYL